jgi:inhibitor of cysteine peptidase
VDEQFSAGMRWLTDADAGSTVELRTGDRLSVRLMGNPTTGYSWEVAAVDAQVLTPASEPGFQASSAAIGSGGVFAFEFQAAGAGQTSLRLVYRRPWEKRRRPTRTFAVNVRVELSGETDDGLSSADRFSVRTGSQ